MEMHKEKMERWVVKIESLCSKVEEQIKIWENTFSSKLYKMDEAVNKTEIFVKSVRYIQLQEQSRLNKSLQEIVENIEIRSKNETELIGEHMNSMLESMSSKIEEFMAVTACVSSSQTFPDYVVRFSTVNFKEGIDNLDKFKSSGKFICEIPGLYYISAHIYTNTQGYGFNVKKNGVNIATSASGSGSTDTTNPISAVVELQPKDTLYVYAGHYIYASQSCMSIMKIN
ncbi:unnamed protein product [Mytilus edulis]|uniref:C1q domain-containing protein n=1 Tax=Mytilus edulis TaxID=6550 RepID=A0A8S3SH60_MYTED|nr:unnamed protein product [Mytilus edulis]